MKLKTMMQVSKAEGWMLTYNTEMECLTIERDDEAGTFKSDGEAFNHVWRLAAKKSAVHLFAMEMIANQ